MPDATDITVSLLGDVMTGRGVDQILPCPGKPELHESHVRDARVYVRLAERANGLIARPVTWQYIWGDLLNTLTGLARNVVFANVETSVTRSNDWWSGKEVHYRMHPENVGCLTAAGIGCCCLANNHVMDWGYAGLDETLRTLDAAGLAHAGAGRNVAEAASPVARPVFGTHRHVVAAAVGSVTSGIPPAWAAGPDQPGVNLLRDLSARSAEQVAKALQATRRPGDVSVVSIHWGANWGYAVPPEQVQFAHRLIDEGVDVVHGHSSHHVKPIEVYRNRPILYGCGDLINDYEGIRGHEEFRTDLRLAYVARFGEPDLLDVRLIPLRARRMRLGSASPDEARWLCDLLTREGKPFGTRAEPNQSGELSLRWT